MLYNSYSDQNSSMDSLSPHRSTCDPPSSAAQLRGSTSQMCLHRILTTIATAPQPPASLLAAVPSLLVPESEKSDAGDGAAACVRECSRFDFNSPEVKESLSSSGGGDTSDVDRGGDRAERRWSMLIEAAELIFGEFVDGDKSELKNDVAAVVIGGELEETPPSPVVRSKRGRTRVLPCRYRDSVVEPLTRFTKTGSAIPVPVKRSKRR